MKLYLSSYKLGNEIKKLKKWIKENGKQIVLITNAKDIYEDIEVFTNKINNDTKILQSIGFEVKVISLKKYFGKFQQLENDFSKYKAFFVPGGNVFVLRKAMQLSGFDKFLKKQTHKSNFLYAGYSAGICVLSPSLNGLDIVDIPTNPYNNERIIYDGLGMINYVPVPHYKSEHPESYLMDKVIEFLIENNMNYKTISDGEVILEELDVTKCNMP